MQNHVSNEATVARPRVPGKLLASRIRDRAARVGIIGMGYVGLPLMLASVAKEFTVLGFDIDVKKVDGLNQGKSPLKHVDNVRIAAAAESRLFEATTDMKRLSETDIIIICVPTPLGEHLEPDLTFVTESARQIAVCLRS